MSVLSWFMGAIPPKSWGEVLTGQPKCDARGLLTQRFAEQLWWLIWDHEFGISCPPSQMMHFAWRRVVEIFWGFVPTSSFPVHLGCNRNIACVCHLEFVNDICSQPGGLATLREVVRPNAHAGKTHAPHGIQRYPGDLHESVFKIPTDIMETQGGSSARRKAEGQEEAEDDDKTEQTREEQQTHRSNLFNAPAHTIARRVCVVWLLM